VPENRFTDAEWFNWGGSIIRGDDGRYRLFYSRFPKSIGFLSWLTHSEIAMAVSDSPTGPWKYEKTVLRGRGPGHWDAVTAHNPKIKRFGDRYFLYYISTRADLSEEELVATAKGGYQHPNWMPLRNRQRAGVATADSPDGPWQRPARPCVEPRDPVFTLTVNPAVTERPDGGYLMMIKGDRRPVRGARRVQGIALADGPTGPFAIQPVLAIEDFDTEDASIWFDVSRRRYYAVFHAHTLFGMITSEDGVTWRKSSTYPFAPKAFAAADGTTFKAGRMERPSVWLDDSGTPAVFISCYRKGNETGIFTIPLE
jgi:alpha-L-fucosidase